MTLVTIPYFVTEKGIEETKKYLSKVLIETGISALKDPTEIDVDMRKIYDATDDEKYLDFSKIVAQKGAKFNSRDFAGLTKPIPITLADGKRWTARPYLVRNGHWDPDSAGNKKLDLEKIQQQLSKAGWSLDQSKSQSYENASHLLHLLCPNGHAHARSWNKWQGQLKTAGKVPCGQCDQEARGIEFAEKMKVRGFIMDINVSEYTGQGQDPIGICMHCGKQTSLPTEKWKNCSKAPCCARSLPPYHPCHAIKSSAQFPA